MNDQKSQNLKWLWWVLGITIFVVVIVAATSRTPTQPTSEPIPPTTEQPPSPLAPPIQSPACTNFQYSEWSHCATDGTQSRTIIKALPEGCSGGNSTLSQNCAPGLPLKNIGPKWDYVSLTPEIFNRIIQKIKSAPNAEIKATKSGEQGSVTFYYSFVAHDPCEPLLKDYLVFEIETTTNVDENGQKYPNGPITDYYVMRDTDHDTYPEDYYTPGEPIPDLSSVCDPRIDEIPFTEDTINGSEMLSFWEAGMNYFAANLLK